MIARPMPPVHPAAELFPMMTTEELQSLAVDIKTNGLQQPVIMFGAHLLDGRNRWKACELAGVEPQLKDWSGKDAVAFVRSLNLHRRHLSAAQRAALAVKAEPVYAEQATQRKSDGQKSGGRGNSKVKPTSKFVALEQAAKEVGAGVSAAKAMKQVAQRAPEVVEMVQRGQVATVAEAKRVAALPDGQRAEVVEMVVAGSSTDEAIAQTSSAPDVDKLVAAAESVDKKATALHGACIRLTELCRALGADVSSAKFMIVKTRALRARSELTKAIDLMTGER